jgi:hypothetical protein
LVLACLAATLVNPYGIGLWTFMATTVSMTRAIEEWQPLWQSPWLNWVPWLLGLVGTLWMWRRNVSNRLSIELALGMLAYASARVMRIEALYVTAAAILLAPALAGRFPRKPWPAKVSSAVVRVLAVVLMIAALVGSMAIGRWATSCVPISGTWAPDLEAMAALRRAGPGRIVTPFNWGEYALWHLSPGLRVSIDGRRETVYSDARLLQGAQILRGDAQGLAVLAQWRAEYVWLPTTSRATLDWLTQNGYRLDLQTAQSGVAVRADLPLLRRTLDESIPPPCFPG